MALDFTAIKAIPMTQVLARYGVALRFSPEWGTALCPLPTHKRNEREKTFQVSLSQNYWKCWSQSCNKEAGCKGGDCINFVALKEKISQYEAAKKLSQWFNIPDEKAAPHIEKPPDKTTPAKDSLEHSAGTPQVKGFMQETNRLLDEWLMVCPEPFRKDLRKKIADRIHLSYLNGQRV